MIKKIDKNADRKRRHVRLRKKVIGTSERPRLCVYRSLANISVQIIDDSVGHTLCAASSLDKDIKAQCEYGGNIEAAKIVGKAIGEKAIEKGIKEVVFDRGGYPYHGRVQALADAAREAGLDF